MSLRHLIIASCAIPLAACVSVPRVAAAPSTAPTFDVVRFFSGVSHGNGTLRVATKQPVRVEVDSDGRMGADGTLNLVQRIREGAKPERTRSWALREISPGQWSGTLTDADGPVSARALPGTLLINFPMDGMRVHQRLTLSSDGQVARNILTVRKWGFTVASLDETITRGPRATR